MAQPRTRLPGVESERIIQEALRRFRLQPIPASSIIGGTSGGSSGGGSSSSGSQFTPTVIHDGETFTVPVDTQVLYALTIDVQGELVVDGDLVGVN